MKNKSPNEDFILIQKAKNGDKKAFEIVMTKYYPRVHSALYAFTKSYEDAEDLTQQAFIKSWTALESFRGDSSFYTWVYRIAINLAKNFVSSSGYKKSRKSDSLDDTYFEISSQSSLESDIPSALSISNLLSIFLISDMFSFNSSEYPIGISFSFVISDL